MSVVFAAQPWVYYRRHSLVDEIDIRTGNDTEKQSSQTQISKMFGPEDACMRVRSAFQQSSQQQVQRPQRGVKQ